MKKLNRKIVSIALSFSMIAGLSACDMNDAPAADSLEQQMEDSVGTLPEEIPADVLVYGTGDITGAMNPFLAQAEGDVDIADITGVRLAYTDRAGDYIMNGSHGESINFGGASYTYVTPADIEAGVTESGEPCYTFTLRSDIKFSDGVALTANDVIFSMYVLCDPSYAGVNAFSSLPIKGLDGYVSGSKPLYELILENGSNNENFDIYSQAQQDAFYDALPAYGASYCQYISEQAVDMYGYFIAENDVVSAMYLWGFANLNEDGSLTGTGTQMNWSLQGDDVPDYADFWNEMCATYGNDYQKISDSESLDRSLFSFFDVEYTANVNADNADKRIDGIEKISENVVRVTLSKPDPAALDKLSIFIAPLHIYGDISKWNPDDESAPTFGLDKGDTAAVMSHADSIGAGAYVLDSYDGVTAHFHANPTYYQGEPLCEKLDLVAMQGGNEMASVSAGYPDISRTEQESDIVSPAANVGLAIYDSGEYGYIGINADNVKADKYAGSSSSKALRRAFAVIFASCARNAVQDGANGAAYIPITSYPSEDALTEARSLLETAGFKLSDGKVTKASDKGKLSYEILVPAGHPALKVAESAKVMLDSLGIELVITPMDDPARIWGLIKAGSVDMWTGVWTSDSDEDIYDRYSTDGKYSYLYDVKMSDVDDAIEQAGKAADAEQRQELYEKARELVTDFAVEIPVFRKNNAYVINDQTVDRSTIPGDLTSSYQLLREVAKIGMQ